MAQSLVFQLLLVLLMGGLLKLLNGAFVEDLSHKLVSRELGHVFGKLRPFLGSVSHV